jgi:predicted AAA+ superfamily ATPase
MELTFNALIEHIKNGQNYFITGPAGVGKTYTIKAIYQRLKTEGVGVVLTSTTGINALNLKGITVHKLFGLTNRSDLGYLGFMKQSFLFHGIKKRLAKLQVIIIDEVSMLRADTFELINQILLQTGDPTKPFGGKTLIFTGDFYQISPVVKS